MLVCMRTTPLRKEFCLRILITLIKWPLSGLKQNTNYVSVLLYFRQKPYLVKWNGNSSAHIQEESCRTRARKDRKHALTHFDSRHQDCNITRISGIFPSICVKIKYSQYFPFLCQELENVQDKNFEWKGFFEKTILDLFSFWSVSP